MERENGSGEDLMGSLDDIRLIGRDDESARLYEAMTAAAQGHNDNPTLANEFIFDWVADRLESIPA